MRILGNRILILRDESKTKTDGGIYIPDNLVENRQTGKVVLIGSEADKRLENQSVLFSPHTGTVIEYNGHPHLLVFATDVIAKL